MHTGRRRLLGLRSSTDAAPPIQGPPCAGAGLSLSVTVEDGSLDPAGYTAATDESYRLQISEEGGIAIEAATVVGVNWALASLASLAAPAGVEGAAECEIGCLPISVEDEPRFSYRGVMLDTARNWFSGAARCLQQLPALMLHRPGRRLPAGLRAAARLQSRRLPLLRPPPPRPPAVEDIKSQVLDPMHQTKLNVLHWHIYDAQSQPLEVRSVPGLWLPHSTEQAYTQEAARDLVQYAFARGIRVVPEFDMPGGGGGWRAEPRCPAAGQAGSLLRAGRPADGLRRNKHLLPPSPPRRAHRRVGQGASPRPDGLRGLPALGRAGLGPGRHVVRAGWRREGRAGARCMRARAVGAAAAHPLHAPGVTSPATTALVPTHLLPALAPPPAPPSPAPALQQSASVRAAAARGGRRGGHVCAGDDGPVPRDDRDRRRRGQLQLLARRGVPRERHRL